MDEFASLRQDAEAAIERGADPLMSVYASTLLTLLNRHDAMLKLLADLMERGKPDTANPSMGLYQMVEWTNDA